MAVYDTVRKFPNCCSKCKRSCFKFWQSRTYCNVFSRPYL